MAGRKKETNKEDLFHYLKIAAAVLFLVFLFLAGFFGFRLGQMIFSDEPLTSVKADHVSYELKVEKGENVLSIGMDLEKHGVIESGLAFYLQSKVYKCRIDPGTYTVNSKRSSKDILKDLNQAYLDARKEKTP